VETTNAAQAQVRELAYRTTDGVEVVLFSHTPTNTLTVAVSDERTGAYFELPAEADRALDIFEHPYAYAAFSDVPYTDALLASWAKAAVQLKGAAEMTVIPISEPSASAPDRTKARPHRGLRDDRAHA
jgi:hypothetical protein